MAIEVEDRNRLACSGSGAMNRAAFAEGSNSGTGWGIIGKTATKFTLVMRERAVWLIFDNEMLKESR